MKPTSFALKSLSILALTGTIASTLSAEAASYALDMTRDGKTLEMVVYDFWSTEYPGPVVAIGKSDLGSTKILGSASMRNPTNDVACTVSNGLYHPWAEKTKTPYEIYTVTGIIDYTATKDTEINYFSETEVGHSIKLSLAAGEKLTRSVYLSEGSCQFVIGNTQKEIQTDCGQVDNNPNFLKTELPSHGTEQWIKFSCKQGSSAYVNVDDLLKQKGVSEGKIESYGSVAR
jgi:hypothetical protein